MLSASLNKTFPSFLPTTHHTLLLSHISLGPPLGINPTTHHTLYYWAISHWVHHKGSIQQPITQYYWAISHWVHQKGSIQQPITHCYWATSHWVHQKGSIQQPITHSTTEPYLIGSTKRDQSNNPSHTLLLSHISLGPPKGINPTTHHTLYYWAISHWVHQKGSIQQPITHSTTEPYLIGSTKRDQSNNPSHTLLLSHISLGPPKGINPTTHHTLYYWAISHWVHQKGSIQQPITHSTTEPYLIASTIRDQSNNPSHTLLLSHISLRPP